MKTHGFLFVLAILSGCNRVSELETAITPSQQSAGISVDAPSDPPATQALPDVKPPTNAPTAPGTPTPSVAELGPTRPDTGSNLQELCTTTRSFPTSNRAIP